MSISAGARLSTTSAYGIRADNNNYISQNGTLSTSGNFISGIHVNDNNEIQMSGSLTATGGTGIYANRNNFIDISGAVNSSGTNGAGIIVYQHNDITVTGTVETTGSEFPGTLGDQVFRRYIRRDGEYHQYIWNDPDIRIRFRCHGGQ